MMRCRAVVAVVAALGGVRALQHVAFPRLQGLGGSGAPCAAAGNKGLMMMMMRTRTGTRTQGGGRRGALSPLRGADERRSAGESSSSASSADDALDEGQWSLYTAQSGRWEGVWTSYDHMGTQVSETDGVWAVALEPEGAAHTLEIERKSLPVGRYRKGALGRQVLAGHGMVTGPSLLRSGLLSTELTVRYGAARVRATVQHAPALPTAESGLEGPALKIYKCVVVRERCDYSGVPTRANEAARWTRGEAAADGVKFWRPVTPFEWRKEWRGESATLTPRTRLLQEWTLGDGLDDNDAWHEARAGEADFTLQLPGGVLVQAPSIIRPGAPAPLRLSWLPRDDTLLRSEATVVALEPNTDLIRPKDDDDDSKTLSFLPPRLLIYRNDAFTSDYILPKYPVGDPNADDESGKPPTTRRP